MNKMTFICFELLQILA